MKNKILVSVFIPSLEKKYDIFVPANEKVFKVKKIIENMLVELSDNTYLPDSNRGLYNVKLGTMYDNNLIIRNTDIRNGTELLLS